MACVTIAHQWDDETTTTIHVEVDATFPQSLDEARAVAVRAFSETLAMFADDE